MRLALKFAYLGRTFHGYQRQPGVRTVEGEIRGALGDLGLGPGGLRFQSASRTDAGVSALGNVVALDTEFRLPGLLRALNSHLEDVWFWAWAPVDPGFRPRDAVERWYRYYLPWSAERDLDTMAEAAALVEGLHDFRGFTRARTGTRRTVREVSVSTEEGRVVVDLRAQAFLWNMVRRLVAALEGVASGRIREAQLRVALEGGVADFGLAPATGLVLMDVSYGFPFETLVNHPSARTLRALEAQRWTEATFLRELLRRMDVGSELASAREDKVRRKMAGRRTRNIKAENL